MRPSLGVCGRWGRGRRCACVSTSVAPTSSMGAGDALSDRDSWPPGSPARPCAMGRGWVGGFLGRTSEVRWGRCSAVCCSNGGSRTWRRASNDADRGERFLVFALGPGWPSGWRTSERGSRAERCEPTSEIHRSSGSSEVRRVRCAPSMRCVASNRGVRGLVPGMRRLGGPWWFGTSRLGGCCCSWRAYRWSGWILGHAGRSKDSVRAVTGWRPCVRSGSLRSRRGCSGSRAGWCWAGSAPVRLVRRPWTRSEPRSREVLDVACRSDVP